MTGPIFSGETVIGQRYQQMLELFSGELQENEFEARLFWAQ